MRKHAFWLGLPVAFIALAVAGTVALTGCGTKQGGTPGPELKKLAKEPTISLYYNDTGKKKDMPMEEYIAGVVAGEMLPNWPAQAYEAQAIVARTFTLELMKRTGGTKKLHGTDMSTDEKETQAYKADSITPVITKAVAATKGMVLTYQGNYIRAYFCSCAGGRTARAKEGLNIPGPELPYTVSKVVDESGATPEYKTWKASLPMTEVQTALAAKGFKNVTEVDTGQKGESGRVTQFALKTSDGNRTIAGNDFRIAVGPDKMRSTLLDSISTEGGQLKMTGKGFGHGVGLSQWAAYTAAKKGTSGADMVTAFFNNVKLEKAY